MNTTVQEKKEIELMMLVDEAVKLDRRMKEDKKNLDRLKARLTAAAYEEIDNKHLRYKQIHGADGVFTAAYKESFRLDDYERLIAIVGEIAKAQITRTAKEEVKYDVEARFKRALTALYLDDFSDEISVEQVLQELGLAASAVKMAAKKLQGEYMRDKKVLESVGVTGEREEELDAIRRYRNWELVEHFFGDLSTSARAQLKRTIWIENQLAAGLEYKK